MPKKKTNWEMDMDAARRLVAGLAGEGTTPPFIEPAVMHQVFEAETSGNTKFENAGAVCSLIATNCIQSEVTNGSSFTYFHYDPDEPLKNLIISKTGFPGHWTYQHDPATEKFGEALQDVDKPLKAGLDGVAVLTPLLITISGQAMGFKGPQEVKDLEQGERDLAAWKIQKMMSALADMFIGCRGKNKVEGRIIEMDGSYYPALYIDNVLGRTFFFAGQEQSSWKDAKNSFGTIPSTLTLMAATDPKIKTIKKLTKKRLQEVYEVCPLNLANTEKIFLKTTEALGKIEGGKTPKLGVDTPSHLLCGMIASELLEGTQVSLIAKKADDKYEFVKIGNIVDAEEVQGGVRQHLEVADERTLIEAMAVSSGRALDATGQAPTAFLALFFEESNKLAKDARKIATQHRIFNMVPIHHKNGGFIYNSLIYTEDGIVIQCFGFKTEKQCQRVSTIVSQLAHVFFGRDLNLNLVHKKMSWNEMADQFSMTLDDFRKIPLDKRIFTDKDLDDFKTLLQAVTIAGTESLVTKQLDELKRSGGGLEGFKKFLQSLANPETGQEDLAKKLKNFHGELTTEDGVTEKEVEEFLKGAIKSFGEKQDDDDDDDESPTPGSLN